MERITRRLVAAILFSALLFTCGCAASSKESDFRTFTDSLQRQVAVPEEIDRVAVTGLTAQMAVFALCPEKLVGVTEPLPLPGYEDLPVLGQLYGGKGNLSREELLSTGAQVIVDIGIAKNDMAATMDDLQAQTGIPVAHIEADLGSYGEAFRQLGTLLGAEEQAKALSDYCDSAYEKACAVAKQVDKVRALYITGEDGHSVIAKGSYHGQVFDLLCDNAAVVDTPSSRGTGNQVSMEQILVWDPEVMVFAPNSVYDNVLTDPVWSTLTAVKTGRVYEVPATPYNWLGLPPGVQQHLGLLWLADALYPQAVEYDLNAEAAEFYRLFYHDAQYMLNAQLPA